MNSKHKLISSLKRLYWQLLGPAAVILACLLALRNFPGLYPDTLFVHLPKVWHAVLFICAAVTAIAGPIMIRTQFAHKVMGDTRVPGTAFLAFQRRLIILPCITPYLALVAVCGNLSEFHAGGIILMALYGVYYYFPSQKRICHDIRMFKVVLS